MKSKDPHKNIMEKIKGGKVRLRSRYFFLAEKLGMGGALAVSIALSAFLFSLLLFLLETTGSLGYLSFGKDGILAFLESLPCFLILSGVGILAIAGFLIAKRKISYKKPFGVLAAGLVIAVMLFGGIMLRARIPEKISEGHGGLHPIGRMVRPMICNCPQKPGHGMAGIVTEVEDGQITVENPVGLHKISLEKIEADGLPIEEGQFVMAVGENKDEIFEARQIHAGRKEIPPAKLRKMRRNCNCRKMNMLHQNLPALCPGCPGRKMK